MLQSQHVLHLKRISVIQLKMLMNVKTQLSFNVTAQWLQQVLTKTKTCTIS